MRTENSEIDKMLLYQMIVNQLMAAFSNNRNYLLGRSFLFFLILPQVTPAQLAGSVV